MIILSRSKTLPPPPHIPTLFTIIDNVTGGLSIIYAYYESNTTSDSQAAIKPSWRRGGPPLWCNPGAWHRALLCRQVKLM